MSGKIHVTRLDDVTPVESNGGVMLERPLSNKTTGSNLIEFEHSVITKIIEAKDVSYTSDEFVYVIEGEAEISFDGQTHQVGPTSYFFVPKGALYDFKMISAPFVTIAAFAPERE